MKTTYNIRFADGRKKVLTTSTKIGMLLKVTWDALKKGQISNNISIVCK